MDIGRAIKVERTRVGLNQEQLAEKVEVHMMTVSRWENGKSDPGYTDLVRLSAVFGRSIHEWVPGEEKTVA